MARPALRIRISALLAAFSLVLLGATTLASPSARATGAVGTGSARSCQRPAHGFVPTKAALPSLGRTVRVIQVRRTRGNAVGGGPLTERGKWLMAMDPQTRPGSGRGTVILSGHAWPDGSALGNAMTQYLQVGHRVYMLGKKGQRACYRITQRTSYPANRVPRKAFRARGPERLVIVTCSGRRLGPGHWTQRTLWYAVPFSAAPPPPPHSAQPPPDNGSGQDGGSSQNGGSGSLLGGLLGGS